MTCAKTSKPSGVDSHLASTFDHQLDGVALTYKNTCMLDPTADFVFPCADSVVLEAKGSSPF